jgi:hypothetical protein
LLSIIIGLRSNQFNDYFEYYNWFISIPKLNIFFNNLHNLPIPNDYLFFFIFSLFKTIDNWYLCLIFISLLSLLSKYIAIKNILNPFYIFIWFIFYFAFIGFQFELVQYRYGLAIGFFLLYLINENFLYYLIAILIHSSLSILIPVVIFQKFLTYNNHLNKNLKALKYILFFLIVNIFYQSFISNYKFDFQNLLDYLPEDLYVSGKFANEFLKTEESFSAIMTFKMILFLLLSLYAKEKFGLRVLLFQVYLAFFYFLFSNLDTLNARISCLIDLIGITFLFYNLKGINNIFFKLIFLFLSLLVLAISFYKFINSPTMYLK